ncbi:hypothetical protein [Halobacillus sp. H74]|uniref:hypothetical protein n=1 Tax=Halobacillus sp. H74 TaxID=3457436 RepID=UPI003FCD3836
MTAQKNSLAFFLLNLHDQARPIDPSIAKQVQILALLKNISNKQNIEDLSSQRNVKYILEKLDEDPTPFMH